MVQHVQVDYPKNFRPNWDSEYYWRYIGSKNRNDNIDDFYISDRKDYDMCCLLMIFYPDENKLFMVRSIL